jgi:lactate dehydrogenase-like 2-hydroxyacid dehydrogenase
VSPAPAGPPRPPRPRVVVTRRLPAPVEEQVAAAFDARLNADDHPFSAAELQDALRSADALLCTVTDRLNADALAVEPLRAKILANFGVGFNHIDVAAAKARGLVVTNTPDVLTDDTADDAVMLMLMVARRAGEGERLVRAGRWTGWRPTHLLGTKVSGKTLGLVGFGRIAKAVARRLRCGFGMRVLFHDPYPPPAEVARELGAEPQRSVEEVIGQADFVSLHCPATPETRHLINAQRLALMKPTAFLINTARGDVVDEAALVAALRAGTIAGAALDVYEREPQVTPELLALENVVLLPHLGSATHETRAAMGFRALENLKAFFAGQPPRDSVV